jgi:hypothetical protein
MDMKAIFGALVGASLVLAPLGAAASAQTSSQPTSSAPAPSAPPNTAAALDPVSLDLAHQIITIAFPPEKRSQMYASMMDAIMGQARANVESKLGTGDKDLDAIVGRSMDRMYADMKANLNAAIPDYFESFARAYARDFSRDDLQAILAFVKTPAGQHYFSRVPELLKDPDVQAANQRLMEKMLAKMPELEAQTLRDIQDYVAKQKKKSDSPPVS